MRAGNLTSADSLRLARNAWLCPIVGVVVGLAGLAGLLPKIAFGEEVGGIQLYVVQPPFEANPDTEQPEPGQRVPQGWRGVEGMVVEVETGGPALARISGHLGFQVANRGGDCQHEDRFMLAIALTINGSMVPGTQATENVARAEHYHDAPFHWVVMLEEGDHILQLEARAMPKGEHDCRAYIKEQQYSRLQVEVLE
jgi:hypothetical protein